MNAESSEPRLYLLLMRLRHGGSLVPSSSCSALELALARAEGRLVVDKDGFGYVYREEKTP